MAQDDNQPAISEAWRDGPLLVVTPHSDLPTRCLKCNAEATAFRVSRKIPTLSAWYPLFSSAGWNSHCVDDRPVHVPFSLCTRHRLQWLARLSLIGLAAMANLFCFALYKTGRFPGPTIDALMTLLPLALAATSLTLRPILRPRRVHHGFAWFAGAGPDFLDSLPELPAKNRSTAVSIAA